MLFLDTSLSRLHLSHFFPDIFSSSFGLKVFLIFSPFVRTSLTFFPCLSSICVLICSSLLAISKTLCFKCGISWMHSDNPLFWSSIVNLSFIYSFLLVKLQPSASSYNALANVMKSPRCYVLKWNMAFLCVMFLGMKWASNFIIRVSKSFSSSLENITVLRHFLPFFPYYIY